MNIVQTAHPLFIGGADVEGAHVIDTRNPATDEIIGTVHLAGAADVDRAVESAQAGFATWSSLTPDDRERRMNRWADLVERDLEELALIDTLDNGAPLSGSRAGVRRAIAQLRYYAGWVTKLTGDTIQPSLAEGEHFAYTLRQPLGIVAAITPWNSPVINMMLKVAPALAAGCAVVVKPSELTPLSALKLARLAIEAGIPDGVLNVVPGTGVEAGRTLASHPRIAKVSFTGSTAVGREIMDAAKTNFAHLTLELGGKSPNIVFDDVDIDKVVPLAAWAAFRNSGQVCVSGSRLYVHERIYQSFLDRLEAFTRGIVVGNGLDPRTQMGPLISAQQADRVEEYIRGGVSDGARLITGGQRIQDEQRPTRQFIAPTVFADVDAGMRIVREEIFGPVVTVTPFSRFDEVVSAANATPYGLAAGLWTNDLSTAHSAAERIDAGMIWINGYSMYDPSLPFGGHKASGYGAKSGREAVLECTQIKTVVAKLRPL